MVSPERGEGEGRDRGWGKREKRGRDIGGSHLVRAGVIILIIALVGTPVHS